jgi:tol-pal system protein YbgF
MVAALAAATIVSPALAQSGRLSLAERVERLEQQAAGQGEVAGNVELLNRITQLQSEVQALRNLVEQQAFEIENLKRRARDQYVDLDSRIARLEGGAPAAAPADGGSPPPAGAEPAAGQLAMEEPEVRAPVDAQPDTSGLGEDSAAPAVATEQPRDERRAYETAFDSLKEGRYAEAARRFQAFLAEFPNGEYAPNAQYWLGESYYVTQNYQIALDAFQQLLSRFPDSAKAPDALLKVGYCHYELRNFAEAEAVLNQVIQQYPDTTVARLAQVRLRALRLENRQ